MPLPWLIGGAVLGGAALISALSDDNDKKDTKSNQSPESDRDADRVNSIVAHLEKQKDYIYSQINKEIKNLNEEMKSKAKLLTLILSSCGVDNDIYWDRKIAQLLDMEIPTINFEKEIFDEDRFDAVARGLNHISIYLGFEVTKRTKSTQENIKNFFVFDGEIHHNDLNYMNQLDKEIDELNKLINTYKEP